MDSFDGHILAFFLAVYHFLHKLFLGDVKAKKDDIKSKTEEALENENVNVNEETDAGKEFVDTENIKGEDDYENLNVKNESCECDAGSLICLCDDNDCVIGHFGQQESFAKFNGIGISKHDVTAAILAALSKHNVSLFYKPEEVQSYTKMQESDDPVLYHFDKSIQKLLPFNRFYVDGMEISASELAKLSRIEMVASEYGGVTNADQDKIKSPINHYTGIYAEGGTVSKFAKLSSLETAVSEHGCVADTDLGGFLIDSHYYYTECFS